MNCRIWQAVRIVCLIPATMYLLLLALVVVGVDDLARWLCDSALAAVWSVPMLLLLTIGGPTLSVIASLILRLEGQRGRPSSDTCGVVAWIVLLLSLCTMLPFPWLFLLAGD